MSVRDSHFRSMLRSRYMRYLIALIIIAFCLIESLCNFLVPFLTQIPSFHYFPSNPDPNDYHFEYISYLSVGLSDSLLPHFMQPDFL